MEPRYRYPAGHWQYQNYGEGGPRGREQAAPGGSRDDVVRPRDTLLYPLANVTIEVKEIKFPITAAVSRGLPVSVLLGTDVPRLG